ncbi:response regulator transcription factor [Dyella subtropica]|uniref:response regulator transcription factor n=1 Tax=Dyella subtropica TaxID=2992127 RepID=UPI00224CBD14|nr:response regulator [Dyella subtropica]
MTAATDTRIYLVDDHQEFRQSCVWILEQAGFQVRDFSSAQALLKELAREAPPARSCIVSDIRMPGMNGLELQVELAHRGTSIPLIFVTGHGDVPLAVNAMRHGAANFIEKPFDAPLLIDAIQTALTHHAPQAASSALTNLTRRERQVLDGVMSGKLNKVIADELSISPKTVELHRSNLMAKLGAHNVVELTRVVLGQH